MAFASVPRDRKHKPHTRPGHSGELHWNARLSDLDIREIVARADEGEPYADIAASFGISKMQVSRIARRVQRGLPWNQ